MIDIPVGSRWRDKDKREAGRVVKVMRAPAYDGDFVSRYRRALD